MDIEREIDHRIQLSGIQLGPDQDEMRTRIRRNIEMENAQRADMQDRPIPTFRLRL